MRRRRQDEEVTADGDGQGSSAVADMNEVVAYNFKRARDLYGWTQDEVADRLEPFLGVRLPQASISGIERGYMGRRREFDAQELVAFARCFDLPIVWFFIPPLDDHRQLLNTSDYVNELYTLLLGREDQLPTLYERFRELGYREPDAADVTLERMSRGERTGKTMADYRTRRKDLLIALLDQSSDEFDKAADDLGAIVDELRQLGLKAFVASKLNDPDYSASPEYRGKAIDEEAEIERLRAEQQKSDRKQPSPRRDR
ncbi:MAG: helix-turn-helix transcriptional regulator [Acidimicrobiales bacterium]